MKAADFVNILADRVCGGRLAPGEWSQELVTGDYTVEVQVRVTRRAAPADAQRHIDAALAKLEAANYWPRCSAGRRSCSRHPAMVLVSRNIYGLSSPEPDVYFRFYCRQHAEARATERDIVGVFALPKYRIEAAKKLVEKRETARCVAQEAENRWARAITLALYAVRGIKPNLNHLENDLDAARWAAGRS